VAARLGDAYHHLGDHVLPLNFDGGHPVGIHHSGPSPPPQPTCQPKGTRLPDGRAAMTAIATPVERSTRYAMLVAPPDGHKPEQVADALAAIVQTLPHQLARSLTWVWGTNIRSLR
jgi:hypothetical protein